MSKHMYWCTENALTSFFVCEQVTTTCLWSRLRFYEITQFFFPMGNFSVSSQLREKCAFDSIQKELDFVFCWKTKYLKTSGRLRGVLRRRVECYFSLCTSRDDQWLDPKNVRTTCLNISQQVAILSFLEKQKTKQTIKIGVAWGKGFSCLWCLETFSGGR